MILTLVEGTDNKSAGKNSEDFVSGNFQNPNGVPSIRYKQKLKQGWGDGWVVKEPAMGGWRLSSDTQNLCRCLLGAGAPCNSASFPRASWLGRRDTFSGSGLD